MAQIKNIRVNRRTRVAKLEFSEGEPLELHEDTLAEFGFRVDDTPDGERLEKAIRRDGEIRCRHGAWRLLAASPKSRKDLERALRQRRHMKADVERVLDDMQAKGFLDDGAFARQFVEQRIRRKQGIRLIEQELKMKGVDAQTAAPLIEEARDSTRDAETMTKLLTAWNRRGKPEDPRKRTAAAAAFLMRRGFESHAVWECIRQFFRADQEDY